MQPRSEPVERPTLHTVTPELALLTEIRDGQQELLELLRPLAAMAQTRMPVLGMRLGKGKPNG